MSSSQSLGGASPVLEKKHKRDKSDHKKKRVREEDDTPRKSKKPKSEIDEIDEDAAAETPQSTNPEKKKKKRRDHGDEELPEPSQAAAEPKESKKSKKSRNDKVDAPKEGETEAPVEETPKPSKKHKKRREQAVEEEETAMEVDEPEPTPPSSKGEKKVKKSKKHIPEEDTAPTPTQDDTSEKKKKKKNKDKPTRLPSPTLSAPNSSGEAMEIDLPTRPKDSDEKLFPFFRQTVSIYIPLYPMGFDKPLTAAAAQHLDPLLNHYSPMLQGVLLSYSNLNLAERPVKADPAHPSTDDTPALLTSVAEYAVGFGRLTFDADIFIPARGKLMEGIVQLQSEGHIGVVCWGKFNAAIEAKRLPKGWKWVQLDNPLDDHDANGQEWDLAATVDNDDVAEQMHTTGYWVDEHGNRVRGKVQFRIKNYDVGLEGDHGYISIEGTCLDDEAERVVALEEREREKSRRAKQLRPFSRRVPEFSMTKLGKEDEEEDSGQRKEVYKGSRMGTPMD